MSKIAKGSIELLNYFKDLGFKKRNPYIIYYDLDPMKRKSGINISIEIYTTGEITVTYTTDDYYEFYKSFNVSSLQEARTLVEDLIKNKNSINKQKLIKQGYEELPESFIKRRNKMIEIKEEVRVGEVILEKGDKIRVLKEDYIPTIYGAVSSYAKKGPFGNYKQLGKDIAQSVFLAVEEYPVDSDLLKAVVSGMISYLEEAEMHIY